MTYTHSKLTTLLWILAGALIGFTVWSSQAAAFGGDDTTVTSDNEAEVSNSLSVGANTGYNTARGGRGADGGDGGDAEGDNATGGNGGSGGSGGGGGSITTGNAMAIGTIDNDINSNDIEVEGCGCDDDGPLFLGWWGGSDDTTVTSGNRASVLNSLTVDANTGDNDASGGKGDDGGDGGDATARSWSHWWFWFNMTGDTTGGNGGSGGGGGNGGTVDTGDAVADGLIINVINRNVVRVMNDDDDDEEDDV